MTTLDGLGIGSWSCVEFKMTSPTPGGTAEPGGAQEGSCQTRLFHQEIFCLVSVWEPPDSSCLFLVLESKPSHSSCLHANSITSGLWLHCGPQGPKSGPSEQGQMGRSQAKLVLGRKHRYLAAKMHSLGLCSRTRNGGTVSPSLLHSTA